MGLTLPTNAAATLDELARAARELEMIRRQRCGPLDADDPLDEAIARLLRYVEQLEAETS
jgi:hypothetical protein